MKIELTLEEIKTLYTCLAGYDDNDEDDYALLNKLREAYKEAKEEQR